MLFVLAAMLTIQAPAPAPAAAQELPPIRAFFQPTPEFCTGGQPRLEHFAKLKADGVKAVLNLRQPGEHRADEEREAVEKAGLKYFNIPVVYTSPTDAQVDEFLKITDDPANRPMFIHCTAAIRVGAFWMIRRAVRDGLTPDAALEEGEEGRPGRRAAPRGVRAQVHRRASTKVAARCRSRAVAGVTIARAVSLLRRLAARRCRHRRVPGRPRRRRACRARRVAAAQHPVRRRARGRGAVLLARRAGESRRARPHDRPSHRRAPGDGQSAGARSVVYLAGGPARRPRL